MKKRDLIIAGLAMLALPANMMAQAVSITRTSDDARVIFTQKFEANGELDADAAWQEWSTTPVGTLEKLTYYGHSGKEQTGLNVYTGEDFKFLLERDSIIELLNGVKATDDKADIAKGCYDNDDATLVFDNGDDPDRKNAFAEFGENGGKYYFEYTSDDATGAGNYSSGIVPNYRRNLFVRGIDIKDNSSYRLTVYVKAHQLGKTKPTFYADVMRGYFHSEKPFSMGYEDDSKHYKYNKTFEYKKEDFVDDKWEKITFMTYYLNDSIADQFVYSNGYWWTNGGEWAWRPAADQIPEGMVLKDGDSLRHIKQPDIFFVRLSFASDSTVFSVDNLSLTKSWIGGVEHHNDMIRVDFGYQTNLKDLAIEAGKNSFVNAVELSGEYFDVYGKTQGKWYKVDINSAEYHDDGYMYMWTKPTKIGNKTYPNYFSVYDSVLVSFRNPDDKALRLNYTGDTFPMALDTLWIQAGKKVHNFTNEISTPNPNIGKGVYSLKNLPPVLTGAEYEKGSFNLDGGISSMQFEFSRPVEVDALGEQSERALLMVTKADIKEFWLPSTQNPEDDADTILVFTRQQKDIQTNGALDGDYKFSLVNIKGQGTDYAQPMNIDYSFGITVVPEGLVSLVDFGGVENFGFTTNSTPIDGFSSVHCTSKVTTFSGLYTKGLMFGIYSVNNNASNNENDCVKLFYDFVIPADGDYDISYGMTGCQKGSYNDDCRTVTILTAADGTEISRKDVGSTGYKPTEGGKIDGVRADTISANLDAGSYRLAFTLPNEGAYGGSHKGGKILFYISIAEKGAVIPATLPIGFPYLNRFNNIVTALASNIQKGVDEPYKYTGDVYTSSKAVYTSLESFTSTKPSAYDAAIKSLTDANNALSARFTVVDNMWKEYDKQLEKLAIYADSLSIADGQDYQSLDAYTKLFGLLLDNEDFECYDKSDAQIDSLKKVFEDAGKALDARKALMDSFVAKMEAAWGILIDPNANTVADEFINLGAVYEIAEGVNIIKGSDDELNENLANLTVAVNEYNWLAPRVEATTVRLKSLARLAQKVGADFGDQTSDVESRIADATDDDLALVEILKSAIKVAIYKEIAENGELADTLDLSGFIRNFNLYSVATNDMVDKYYYQWGEPHDRWKAKAGETEDIFPGWKVNPNGQNVHIGSEATAWDENKAPVFDAYLAMDWNAFVSMSQTVENLPAGVYNIGVGFNVCVDAGNLKHTFSATTSDSVYSVLAPMNIGSDTHTRPDAANLWLDSVVVANVGDNVTLDIKMANVNSWAMIDNFAMILSEAVEGVDYGKEATAEQLVLDELLSFVDSYEAAQVKVEYTTLDGIVVPAPQPGQILIRIVTINGKSEAKTVIIK
jgi:hypothetical protein